MTYLTTSKTIHIYKHSNMFLTTVRLTLMNSTIPVTTGKDIIIYIYIYTTSIVYSIYRWILYITFIDQLIS